MHFPLRSTVLAVALVSMPEFGHAQATHSSTHFNIAAGATLPTGTFSDAVDVGYHFTVGLGVQDRSSALGFRAEGTYNAFSAKSGGGDVHVAGLTANASYDLANMGTTGSKLYAIGGIGFYDTKVPGQSETDFGWNFGGGFRFPLSGFSAYLEARYHQVSNADAHLVPISFGLLF
ncbi:MAG TPA: hypothetical protein VLN49_14435 [Gemmatimonadaceae bacterium]|nr:hypothetical protein [Gemmatimonadaceae bacterium]